MFLLNKYKLGLILLSTLQRLLTENCFDDELMHITSLTSILTYIHDRDHYEELYFFTNTTQVFDLIFSARYFMIRFGLDVSPHLKLSCLLRVIKKLVDLNGGLYFTSYLIVLTTFYGMPIV